MRYIGARYVPIFYVNSGDGSIDWEMNVVYEPLTYVRDTNNHLYLSKKMVPDSVGHPADNILYWLDVTTFLGSTQDLQDQIDDIVNNIIPPISNDLDTLQNTTIPEIQDDITVLQNADPLERFRNKKICVIGDSISDFGVLADNWVKLLTDFMHDNYNCTVINESDGGRSMASLSNDLNDQTVVIPQADAYILFIGLNDWQGSENWGWGNGSNPMIPSAQNVDWNIYSKNHNAEWFFVSPMKFFVTATINANKTPLLCYRSYYEKYFASRGYTVLSGYNMPEMNSNTVSAYTLDGLHPNADYAHIMFRYILDGLKSGRSNITGRQLAKKNYHNTITTSSDINLLFDDYDLRIQIQINNWSPTINQWVDLCDAPNILDTITYPEGYFSQATNKCQYRISGGKLQIFLFSSVSSWGDEIIFPYGLNQNN